MSAERIRFGPAGNARSFYEQGYTRSEQMPAWLAAMGLSAYEYSFGRGISIGREAAQAIGAAAREQDIALSCHAPYYINLSNPDPAKRAVSREYIRQGLEAAGWMGAARLVFHPGSCARMDRAEALSLALHETELLAEETAAGPWSEIVLCPETMGKMNQLGTLDEVLALCRVSDTLIPTLDFGHLNARTQGGLATEADFAAVLDAVASALGAERLARIHIHFSRIEYTQAGEKRHLTFEDTQYGPFFEPLARQIATRGMTPVIICESRETMAEDALAMKNTYEDALAAL